MTSNAETREHWAKMEKSGESFESWQQRGFKTPTKPKKPKPKPKPKKAVKKKAAKKRVSKKRARTKRSSKKLGPRTGRK